MFLFHLILKSCSTMTELLLLLNLMVEVFCKKIYFIITQTSVQDCKVLHLKNLKDILHPHSIKFSLSKLRDMAVMDNYHTFHHCDTDVWVRASEVTPALYWSLNFAEVASYTRNPQIWFLPSAFPISN